MSIEEKEEKKTPIRIEFVFVVVALRTNYVIGFCRLNKQLAPTVFGI